MQMTLDSNTGCYEMADVNMYYLYPMSCRGGAKFQCVDFEGGQIFSAPMPRGGKFSVRRNLGIPRPPRYRLIMTAPLEFTEQSCVTKNVMERGRLVSLEKIEHKGENRDY